MNRLVLSNNLRYPYPNNNNSNLKDSYLIRFMTSPPDAVLKPLNKSAKPLIHALRGGTSPHPPIWLMRQAGRYLPEYRKVRAEAGSFLDLCYSPKRAAEVTLQPIRRYDLDAAILFSDILVVPDALGQQVCFVEGEGPRLDPVRESRDLATLDLGKVGSKFESIWETLELIRADLPAAVALIGFCGAPWTVATYMVGGRGSPDQAETRLRAYADPVFFQALIDVLTEASLNYLSGQIAAGAEVIQIFDSWAGNLPEDEFQKWVIAPTEKLVRALKQRHPEIPVIGFPRGAGPRYRNYINEIAIDAVGCDTSLSLDFIAGELQTDIPVQGNLDPLLLVSGGARLNTRIDEILEALSNGPFVFNLGHGIVPQTPPDHVAGLVRRVRGDEQKL